MRPAVSILISLFALSFLVVSPAGAQQENCDLNQNGFVDIADLMQIAEYVGGSEGLDSLPDYWQEGDCDCDKLHLTVADVFALSDRMIYGYGHWKFGRQVFPQTVSMAIERTQAAPGEQIELPVYVGVDRQILGLQFYVVFDTTLVNVSDFVFSDSLPEQPSSAIFVVPGGLSVYAFVPENFNFDFPIGYLQVHILPDAPPGEIAYLSFSNDPHRALYTGLAAENQDDDIHNEQLNFILPVTVDGKIFIEPDLSPNPGEEEAASAGFSPSPNPFNSSVEFSFYSRGKSNVNLEIFDLLGRRVACPVEGIIESGQHHAVWKADGMPSGVYICRLVVDDEILTRRITLLK